MKKVLAIVISVLMLVGMAPVSSFAASIVASGVCGLNPTDTWYMESWDNLTWTLDSEGTLTIRGVGEMNDFTEGSPWLKASVRTLIIEPGVTSIGARAFDTCSNLTSITIADSVTSIGRCAFDFSAWYNNQPDGLVYVGKVAYRYKGTMPEGAEISLENGTTGVNAYAFSGQWGLKSVAIPNSVKVIGENSFSSCGLTSVTIPGSVTSIGYSSFSGCCDLTSVTIKSGVTNIGSGAFERCTSLTDVTIPDSVASIGGSAFANTAWYDNQPDGLVYIGKLAYRYKGEMPWGEAEIDLRDGTTAICPCTFSSCGLRSITIPDSVTYIGDCAFDNCWELESITIPDSVTSIGISAFAACPKLAEITVAPNNPVYYSKGNCIIERETGTLVFGCKNSVIPTDGNVTAIGEAAFDRCIYLSSITIPNGVTSIGLQAFMGCTFLTSVTIPVSVKTIYTGAFYNCDYLSDVTYGGTEKQWDAINIEIDNEPLLEANIHFKNNRVGNNSFFESILAFFSNIIAFFKRLFSRA